MPGRVTLGLVNTYDPGMWHDVMRVNLARAAPVALAFDCDLAAFGFPFAQARARGSTGKRPLGLRTALDVARFIAGGTTIGNQGRHFLDLAEAGRFTIHEAPAEAHWPRDAQRLGEVVATTPDPAIGKATTPRQLAARVAAGSSALVVYGLGPRGLPRHVLDGAPRHVEITGRRVSLDTATALGALPAMLRAHLEHLGGTP